MRLGSPVGERRSAPELGQERLPASTAGRAPASASTVARHSIDGDASLAGASTARSNVVSAVVQAPPSSGAAGLEQRRRRDSVAGAFGDIGGQLAPVAGQARIRLLDGVQSAQKPGPFRRKQLASTASREAVARGTS